VVAAMNNRCLQCGDPTHNNWTHCRKCHAWNDVFVGLHPRAGIVDLYCLRRGLRYLTPRRSRFVTAEAFAKLARRVADLELEVEALS
jgi:hypothetical protein